MPTSYRFGVFEFHVSSGELLKDRQRVRIQEKPLQMLGLLLERAGEVVSREELRERLWPSDTFVEFDDNLNSTVKRVREALGDTADRPRYIQTVPKRGYRFIPPVEAADPAPAPAPKSRRLGWFAVAIAMGLIAVLVAIVWKSRPAEHRKIMLAVLPFRNLSGDASQDYWSEGITEELIAHLGRLSPSKLGVISMTSSMHFKNSTEDVAKIGSELGVAYILEGSVRRMDGRADVTAQLIQLSDRTHLWAETYGLTGDGFSALPREVAQGVAKALAIRLLPAEATVLARAATINTAAYDAYLSGSYQWNRGTKQSFQEALENFQRAAELDPKYGIAHTGIAKCYLELGDYRLVPSAEAVAKAKEESTLALKLDDSIPESHSVAAAVLDRSDPAASGVDEGYRRAIAINPSDARARRQYAVYLMYHHRGDEASVQISEALHSDPISASIHSYAGWIFYSNKDYQRAWRETATAIKLDPNYPFALYIQGHLYEHEAKHAEAIGQYSKAVASSGRAPKYLYSLAGAYIAAGNRDAAAQILNELRAQAKTGYVPEDYLQHLSQKLGM